MSQKKKITLRLSAEQYTDLKTKSQDNGISMEEFLRRSLTNNNWILLKAELEKILAELKAEGRLLNQLTRKINSNILVNEKELANNIKEMNELWQSLKQFLVEQV